MSDRRPLFRHVFILHLHQISRRLISGLAIILLATAAHGNPARLVRPDADRMINSLAAVTPEGVRLQRVEWDADGVFLQGCAIGSARVATLMRSLEDSPHFANPELLRIKSSALDGVRCQLFDLKVQPQATAHSVTASGRRARPDELQDLLVRLNHQALGQGLQVRDFQIGEPKQGQGGVPLTLRIHGSFEGFAGLWQDWSSLEPVVLLGCFSLQGQSDNTIDVEAQLLVPIAGKPMGQTAACERRLPPVPEPQPAVEETMPTAPASPSIPDTPWLDSD